MVLGQAQKVVLGEKGLGVGERDNRLYAPGWYSSERRKVNAMRLQRLGKPTLVWQAQPGCSKLETAC